MLYIPEELKGDVARFLNSKAGMALIAAAKSRLPITPALSSELHTIACEYAYREGAENMLNDLQHIHEDQDPSVATQNAKKILDKELSELTENEKETILTNPAD